MCQPQPVLQDEQTYNSYIQTNNARHHEHGRAKAHLLAYMKTFERGHVFAKHTHAFTHTYDCTSNAQSLSQAHLFSRHVGEGLGDETISSPPLPPFPLKKFGPRVTLCRQVNLRAWKNTQFNATQPLFWRNRQKKSHTNGG
jgi:hypothetical protein